MTKVEDNCCNCNYAYEDPTKSCMPTDFFAGNGDGVHQWATFRFSSSSVGKTWKFCGWSLRREGFGEVRPSAGYSGLGSTFQRVHFLQEN